MTPGVSGTPRAPRPPFRRLATTACRLTVGLDTPTFADALPTGDYLQAYSEEQGLGFAGQAAMYILSGVIGVAVLTITFRLVSLTVKESGAHGNSRAA